MKHVVLICIVLTLCSFNSCNKKDQPGPVSIVGKWRWVKSVGGFAGQTITPQKAKYNLREEFNADSTFKTYKNDSVTVQGKYSIIKNYKLSSSNTVDVLKTNKSYNQAFTIHNDTLFINDVFISDGFSTIYVRMK
jgi:hypothetical protein